MKINKIILSLLIGFIVAVSISNVSAIDENDTSIISTSADESAIANEIVEPVNNDIKNTTIHNIDPKTNITELNKYIKENVSAGDTLNFTKNGVYNFTSLDGIVVDKNIIVQGNNATFYALQGFQIYSKTGTIDGTQIYNLNFIMTNETAKWNGRGIEIRNGANIIVENCTFLNGNSGVYLSATLGNITVRNCRFNGTTDISSIGKNKETGTKAINIMGGSNILVENNFFGSQCLDGVSIASGGQNVNVRNNTFVNNWYGVFYGDGVGNVNTTNNTFIDIIKIAIDFKKAAGTSIVSDNIFKLAANNIGLYIEQGNTAHGSPSNIETITVTNNKFTALDQDNPITPYTIQAVRIGSANGALLPVGTITIANNTYQTGIKVLTFMDKSWIENETSGDYIILPASLDSKFIGASNKTVESGSYYRMQLTGENGIVLPNQNVKISIVFDEEVIDTINTKTNDFGIIDIPLNYDEGKYTLKLTYNGTDKIIGSYYFNKVDQEIKNIIIKSNAKTTLTLEKDSIYFGGELKYILKDKKGNGIADANITININGKDYIRTTDSNGNAFMKLKLQPKTYTITAKYAGNKVNPNASTINQVKVNSIILTQDVVKYFKNGTQFNAKLVDSDGNPVANKIINFNINGVFYHKETNKEGIATLNINLRPNTYIITSEYDNCFVSNNVTVKTTLVTNDLTKVYLGPKSFNATVLDGQGKALANQNVTFNINGVFYTKTTNSNGIASLSIRLMAGEYIITSIYDGYATSNKVTVKA